MFRPVPWVRGSRTFLRRRQSVSRCGLLKSGRGARLRCSLLLLRLSGWVSRQRGRRKNGGLPQSPASFLGGHRVLRSFVVGLRGVLQGSRGVGPEILSLLDCWVMDFALLKP